MSLALSGGRVMPLESALRSERNILHASRTSSETSQAIEAFDNQRENIGAACALHLGLSTASCIVQPRETWIYGRFNLCILVHAKNQDGIVPRKVFRCPLPHKTAERYRPGSIEENYRTEIANYAYMERHCAEVPIAKLIGFGISNAQYTHERHLSLFSRYVHRAWRLLRTAFQRRDIAPFARRSSESNFAGPYMVLEYIEPSVGMMLSTTWAHFQSDSNRRQNLYRGISRLMLHLARLPQPRIGSFRFNDDNSIELASSPILSSNTVLESEGVPRTWHHSPCCTGSFLTSLLNFRHRALLTQPNAANSDEDCRLQMSSMILLRIIMPQLVDYEYKGPFMLQYTDLHASNILVDNEWNITGIIDLESVCSLPPVMSNIPWWLSATAIDDQDPENDEQRRIRDDFLHILEEEEGRVGSRAFPLSKVITETWASRAYFALACLTTIDGLTGFLEDHLYPAFDFGLSLQEESVFMRHLSRFWSTKSEDFIQKKQEDKARYIQDMERLAITDPIIL